MKFLVGLFTGLILGAAGAVAYSVKSGRDLRESFEEVRADLNRRDTDALGARLEARVTEIQTRLEERIAQVREHGAGVPVDTGEAAAETAVEAVSDAAETAETAVEAAVETAVEDQPGA